MDYIDLHAHMVSRTSDDYARMAQTGCVALTEPAFWPGFDRKSADGFEDYFHQLTDFEPKRAAQYGIRHYAWLCLNPKEGEDRALTQAVLERIPRYLTRGNVVGIGEIGLNRITLNEIATFRDHIELALQYDQSILIHTPHLEDKRKGTAAIIEVLREYPTLDPERVLVDHAEEHTIDMILDAGYWCGITLYPQTKASVQRAADMIELRGPDRICVNSACDWGASNPLAVPDFIMEMRRRQHSDELIARIVNDNPRKFLRHSPNFKHGTRKPSLQVCEGD